MCQILEQAPSSSTNGQPKQRDDKGRFTPGNSGGPGNPFGRRVAEMRKAMLAAVSLQDIADVFQELLAKAKTGDVQAMKLFLAYTVGKPEKVQTLPMGKELLEVMNQPTPDMPLKMVNYTRSAIGFLQQKQLEGAHDKKEKKSEAAPSTDGKSVEQAAGLHAAGAAETGKLIAACPTTRTPLPKGSYTDVPPGMAEFYDTLVKRGFAPPVPDDQKRS